jgi:CheY-like chemotaxis protein
LSFVCLTKSEFPDFLILSFRTGFKMPAGGTVRSRSPRSKISPQILLTLLEGPKGTGMADAIAFRNGRQQAYYQRRQPPIPTPIERKPLRVRNILYAEDDQEISAICTRILNRAGYRITVVGDGDSAWEALSREKFDLLVTDNDMPNLSGVELVAKLRLNKVNLPIILASGSADFFSGEEYRWLNLSACLQKPFAPEDLLRTVAKVLHPATHAASSRLTATTLSQL